MTRRLIKVDGTEVPLDSKLSIPEICKLIGAQSLDTVQLQHLGHPIQVMLVDDVGAHRDLKVNEKATAMYVANCRPGTTWQIRGDVVVTYDEDFA